MVGANAKQDLTANGVGKAGLYGNLYVGSAKEELPAWITIEKNVIIIKTDLCDGCPGTIFDTSASTTFAAGTTETIEGFSGSFSTDRISFNSDLTTSVTDMSFFAITGDAIWDSILGLGRKVPVANEEPDVLYGSNLVYELD